MDNYDINQHIMSGNLIPGVLPHLDNLHTVKFIFQPHFGLNELPLAPGLIFIRGPRQYGKSTWLEQQIADTLQNFGPGSALYLNGDEIIDAKQLLEEIRVLGKLFTNSKVKRLFIDEITAIQSWEKAIKRLVDAGELKDILLITTGSKATDLRRGVERLPGRKGKLERSNFIFTPISYTNFKKACGDFFGNDTLYAYILSGGSPVGANVLAETGRIPEYIIAIISDWILGEFSASGRSRSHLLAVLQSLYKMAGTPIGQAKLARESGLANNTVAHGYIELLSDLMTIIPAYPYDTDRKITLFRKPCKYHFINVLMALTWHPKKPRTISELKNLGQDLGAIFEWVVAQEIWRRLCVTSQDLPDVLNFWQSKEHELDFVLTDRNFIEVKSGKSNPLEFSWYLKSFHHSNLTVISQSKFSTESIQGITLEDFLLENQS